MFYSWLFCIRDIWSDLHSLDARKNNETASSVFVFGQQLDIADKELDAVFSAPATVPTPIQVKYRHDPSFLSFFLSLFWGGRGGGGWDCGTPSPYVKNIINYAIK